MQIDSSDEDPRRLDRLSHSFFSELGNWTALPGIRLDKGRVFAFEETLAYRTRPQDSLSSLRDAGFRTDLISRLSELPAIIAEWVTP